MDMKKTSIRQKNYRSRKKIIEKLEIYFDLYIDSGDNTPSQNKPLYELLNQVHQLIELENNKGESNVRKKR